MKRNVDINEISDGKLYTANDMLKQIVMTAKDVPIAVREWENLLS